MRLNKVGTSIQLWSQVWNVVNTCLGFPRVVQHMFKRVTPIFIMLVYRCEQPIWAHSQVLWFSNFTYSFNETSFNETIFLSALKNIQKISHMMTKQKKTLIYNRKKTKINYKNLNANCSAVSNLILLCGLLQDTFWTFQTEVVM